MTSHLAHYGFLKRDNEVGRNALVSVDALPYAWLARITAACQFGLPSREPYHLINRSFFAWHE